MRGEVFVDEENEVFAMKRTVLLPAFALTAALVYAGDLAVLENLGFSSDGRYFMFGQHVLITGAGQAYAETAVVDVPRNNFVADGWKKRTWNVRMLPNQDSRGALYELLAESVHLKKRYGISHLEQGRMLYTRSVADEILMDGEKSDDSTPALSFRDFERGREYTLVLVQKSKTADDEVSASFRIELTVIDPSGVEVSYTVGRPDYMRRGVASYRITRVWIGPDGKSLVIAVAKESPDLSVRYMVETLVPD